MTTWDRRAFARALFTTVLGLIVVWLVTAASDEGQLTASVRAGRTLPLVPLCGAVGAALALGTARVREEIRALEALGRSPSQTLQAVVFGAALPSLLVAVALQTTSVDVAGFYPRAAHGEAFSFVNGVFESTKLGVRVATTGEAIVLPKTEEPNELDLPRYARGAASSTTALAGLALALTSATAVVRSTPARQRLQRSRRLLALAAGLFCAVATLVAFQAAAARLIPAWASAVPSTLLVGLLYARQAVRRSAA